MRLKNSLIVMYRDLIKVIAYFIPIGEHQNFVRVNKLFLESFQNVHPDLSRINELNAMYDKCHQCPGECKECTDLECWGCYWNFEADVMKEFKGRRSPEALCYLLAVRGVNTDKYYKDQASLEVARNWIDYMYKSKDQSLKTEIRYIFIRNKIYNFIVDYINFDVLLNNKHKKRFPSLKILTEPDIPETKEALIRRIQCFDSIQMYALSIFIIQKGDRLIFKDNVHPQYFWSLVSDSSRSDK